MRKASWLSAVVILALAPWGASVLAQEAEGVVAETFVEARPIRRSAPDYPPNALNRSQEGWVMLSFVISPDGEVIEPMIEDSSGIEGFEREALKAVKRWRYEPATRDGEPVEQSMVRTRLSFRLEGLRGATARFRKTYTEIAGIMQQGDFAAAEPLLEELELGGRSNLYEDAWFWWLKYTYLDGTRSSDSEAKASALRRALGYEEDFLSPDQFVVAAQRLVALEMQASDVAAARWGYERLRDSKAAKSSEYYEKVMAVMTPAFDKIEQAIAGDRVLVTRAKIGNHGYWVHDLLRRSFSFGNVAGRIDVVDVRCSRGTKRYDSFPLDGVWNVPEGWGECGAYIKGDPGTTFDFEERAPTPSAQLLLD